MIFKVLQIAVPFVWFGLVGGISFMETPLKFHAPNITLPLGLGIGRLTFSVINKVEIAFAILLLISFLVTKSVGRIALLTFGAISFLLFLQTIWLLPALDIRAALIISGNEVPASSPHIFYVVFEFVKVILLFALGTSLLKNCLTLK